MLTFDILAKAKCRECGRTFEWTYRASTKVLSKWLLIYFLRWLKSIHIPKEHTDLPFACPCCHPPEPNKSETDLACPRCGKFLWVEPGSETAWWLKCHGCGFYIYWVSDVLCSIVWPLSDDFVAKAKSILGQQYLRQAHLDSDKVRQIRGS